MAIYADFKLDESYTPHKVSIRAGNSAYDLREIKTLEMEEPSGWQCFSLCPDTAKYEWRDKL